MKLRTHFASYRMFTLIYRKQNDVNKISLYLIVDFSFLSYFIFSSCIQIVH